MLKSVVLSCLLVLASASAGLTATYNLGDVTSGTSTTRTLAVRSLDYIGFTLAAPGGFEVSELSISVTSVSGSNLREMIALYSGGRLVASSDSGVGRGGGTATLSFSGANMLANGAYTLVVGGWRSFFTPDIANARSTASFNNGRYSVGMTSQISPIPLPASGVLGMAGLGALALLRRKTRTAAV